MCGAAGHTRVWEESRALHGLAASRISLLSRYELAFTGSTAENTNERYNIIFMGILSFKSSWAEI